MKRLKKNIPNALSLSRILLAIILLQIQETGDVLLSILILAAAVLTDLLDGYLSRQWSITSKTGAAIDAVSDFIFISLCFNYFLQDLRLLFICILIISGLSLSGFIVKLEKVSHKSDLLAKYIGVLGYILVLFMILFSSSQVHLYAAIVYGLYIVISALYSFLYRFRNRISSSSP